MKKLFFYMVAAAIALTSCSSEDVVEVNNGNAIDFRVAMGPGANSRSVVTTSTNIPSFYVTAILDGGKGENYFEDELYLLGSSSFAHENAAFDYFWPANEDIKFFAYTYGVQKTDGKPGVTELDKKYFGSVSISKDGQTFTGFSPMPLIEDQVDFVTAQAVGSRADNESAPVELEFNHALSQIKVSARNKHPFYEYEIYGVKIANVISEDNFDMGDSTWENSSDSKTSSYTITYNSPVVLSSTLDDPKYNGLDLMGGDAAMLIPQPLSPCEVNSETDVASPSTGSYIAVLMRVISTDTNAQVYPKDSNENIITVNNNGTDVKCAWAIVPIDTEWEIGNEYVYVLDFTNGAGYDEGTGIKIFKGLATFTLKVNPWASNKEGTEMPGND